MHKICKNCGASNSDQARFCAKCGSSLSVSEPSHDKAEKRTVANNMLNKRNIIIGVIIVAVIASVVFFSRNNSSTPDASVLERGVKNLTRDSAAKKIEEYLRVNPGSDFGKNCIACYDETNNNYQTCAIEDCLKEKFQQLEQEGFVKIIKTNMWGYAYEFTDKAKPYLVTRGENKNLDIILKKLISVEVTGLTSEVMNMRTADYTAKYEPTPIGKIVDEKNADKEVKNQMSFELYDDGWRIGRQY